MIASISLVRGALPMVVIALGAISVVLAFEHRRGVWRRQARIAVPVAAALIGVAVLLVEVLGLIPWAFPLSFYVWVGLVLLTLAAGIAGWRAFPRWRRAFSPLPVVLTAAMAGMLINQQYQYYPTLGALLGEDAPNLVSMAELERLRDDAEGADGQAPEHGYTVELPIPATTSGFSARPALVWVPPQWFVSREPLPVIELLAGVPGGPADWTRAGRAAQTADEFAARHGGRAPLMVMPDANGSLSGDTECVDSPRGRAETYLTVDVPRAVAKAFGASAAPGTWAVAGLSAGGTCAMTLSLRNPARYAAFADYSGLTSPTVADTVDRQATTPVLFGGSNAAYDAHDPLAILATTSFPELAAWFEVGTADAGPLAAQRRLVPLARKAGLAEVCHREIPGGRHDFDVWAQSFEDSLPWLSARLGVTPEPADAARHCGR